MKSRKYCFRGKKNIDHPRERRYVRIRNRKQIFSRNMHTPPIFAWVVGKAETSGCSVFILEFHSRGGKYNSKCGGNPILLQINPKKGGLNAPPSPRVINPGCCHFVSAAASPCNTTSLRIKRWRVGKGSIFFWPSFQAVCLERRHQ